MYLPKWKQKREQFIIKLLYKSCNNDFANDKMNHDDCLQWEIVMRIYYDERLPNMEGWLCLLPHLLLNYTPFKCIESHYIIHFLSPVNMSIFFALFIEIKRATLFRFWFRNISAGGTIIMTNFTFVDLQNNGKKWQCFGLEWWNNRKKGKCTAYVHICHSIKQNISLKTKNASFVILIII